MGVPTVFMVGEERLALVPEYLNLGSVVVIAPDRATLLRWQEEQAGDGGESQTHPEGTVVDMRARQILWQGSSLPLSQLEFQVLQALLGEPGGPFVPRTPSRRMGRRPRDACRPLHREGSGAALAGQARVDRSTDRDRSGSGIRFPGGRTSLRPGSGLT